jgi:hypothetical protein
MKTTKTLTLILIAVLSISALALIVAAISPEKPDTITGITNRTASYPNGTKINFSRGMIHVIRITHAQPTLKWIGYIGNVTGTFALKDESSNKLFDWTMGTITGEVYATKETSCATNTATNIQCGGIPSWANMICANQSMINDESGLFNHSNAEGDTYKYTFLTTPFVLRSFYAGDKLVNDTLVAGPAGTNCFGINLNTNNSHTTAGTNSKWQEVVLTDLTSEDESGAGGYGKPFQFDLVYAALLSNKSYGYNRQQYDFQILLPQLGRQGTVNNIPFYFYVELV